MWVWNILTSEFFWGVIIGLLLSIVGSYFLALFSTRQQEQARKRALKTFCADTLSNLRQIIDDMESVRSKSQLIHNDYLLLLDIEIQVFGRNREHLIQLPESLRDKVRKFVTDCAIRRAEIGNNLTTFSNQWSLGNQLQAQGNGPEAQRTYDAARTGPLAAANKAVDSLIVRAKDSNALIAEINNTA
jgi:hypothetical protein